MKERALTIWQPWATLEVLGIKPVENRTRPLPGWAYVCPDCNGSGGDAAAIEATLGFVPCPTCDGTDIEETNPGEVWEFFLWIHAGKRQFGFSSREADAIRDLLTMEEYGRLRDHVQGDPELARNYVFGALIGHVTATGCHHATDCRRRCECWCHRAMLQPLGSCCGEGCDGYVYCTKWSEPDAWHWMLDGPIVEDDPIPMRGWQGLWRLPEGV